MADPEGNLFCVIPVIPAEPFEVDDRGRASYLKPQHGTVGSG